MILKELELENYKIFYGNNVLRFDSNKKIFVIEGMNGYGKSTLVESILFALYGKASGKVINEYATQRNESFCRVNLEFEHDGNSYRAERKIVNGKEDFTLKVNGSKSLLKIENIIPESIAKFSIMDCEKFARVIGGLSFEEIWGIKELKDAKNDLELLKSKLERSLSKFEKMKLVVKKALGLEVNRLEARKLEKLVTEENKKIKILSSKIDELETLSRAKEFLEKEKEFRQNFQALILKTLLEEAVKVILKRKDEAIKARLKQGRLSAERELLEKILAEEKCICGSKLSTSHFGKREIASLASRLRKEEELFASLPLEGYAQSSYELNSAAEKTRNLKINVEELKKERKELLHAIPKARNLNFADLTKKLEELKLERKARELRVIELEEEYKNVAKKIRKFKSRSRKNILLKIRKLENLICAFDEIIECKSREESAAMTERASHTLKRLTNKPAEYEGIALDSTGKLEMLGSALERLSDGELQIVGLSLIAGLSNEFLVIDAPFTRLDSIHKKNLIANLQKLANQLIILVTDEDYKDIKEFADSSWELAHNETIRSSRIKCIS